MTASYRPPGARRAILTTRMVAEARGPTTESPDPCRADDLHRPVIETPSAERRSSAGAQLRVREKPSSRARLNVNLAFAMNLAGNTTEPTIPVTTTPVLERLAQALDRVPAERRELVEEQHTVARQCS
jgi:hypothetical protein